MDENRLVFSKEMLAKAKTTYENDAFVSFMVIWISLNVLYDTGKASREYLKIQIFFTKNADIISRILSTKSKEMQELVKFIESTPQHYNLNLYLKDCNAFTDTSTSALNRSTDFGRFVSKVRNNMFHGTKIWSNEDEEGLLIRLIPTLILIVESLHSNYQNFG